MKGVSHKKKEEHAHRRSNEFVDYYDTNKNKNISGEVKNDKTPTSLPLYFENEDVLCGFCTCGGKIDPEMDIYEEGSPLETATCSKRLTSRPSHWCISLIKNCDIKNVNAGILLILIFVDIVTSSLSSVLWYRLNKNALQYAYLYSQIYFPITFFFMIWPVYYMFKIGESLYPKIFGGKRNGNVSLRLKKNNPLIYKLISWLISKNNDDTHKNLVLSNSTQNKTKEEEDSSSDTTIILISDKGSPADGHHKKTDKAQDDILKMDSLEMHDNKYNNNNNNNNGNGNDDDNDNYNEDDANDDANDDDSDYNDNNNNNNNDNNDDDSLDERVEFDCGCGGKSDETRSNDNINVETKTNNPNAAKVAGRFADVKNAIMRHYFVFALLDTIVNALVILPVLYFSPVFLILFSQLLLPLNMIGSYIYLKRKYTAIQVFSVLFVIFAIILSSFPDLSLYFEPNNSTNMGPLMVEETIIADDDEKYITHAENNSTYIFKNDSNTKLDDKNSNGEASLHATHYIILFVILILVKLISTFSSIYKEQIYKKYHLDPIKTVAIVGSIQIPLSIPFIFFLFVPLPQPAIYIEPSQFTNYLLNGTMLLLSSDNNYEIFFTYIIYIFCVIIASIIDFIITQKISSTFNIINNISILTLSVLLMGWKDLAGSAYKEINLYEYLSIFLIVLAILNYWKGTPPDEESQSDGRELSSSPNVLRDGAIHIPNIINGIGPDNRDIIKNRRKIHGSVYMGNDDSSEDSTIFFAERGSKNKEKMLNTKKRNKNVQNRTNPDSMPQSMPKKHNQNRKFSKYEKKEKRDDMEMVDKKFRGTSQKTRNHPIIATNVTHFKEKKTTDILLDDNEEEFQ